jgi:hypothetical protein
MKNEGNESMESQCVICHNLAEDVVISNLLLEKQLRIVSKAFMLLILVFH